MKTRRLIWAAGAAAMMLSGEALAQNASSVQAPQNVTIIIPEKYRAFDRSAAPKSGPRVALELRAVIARRPPWSADSPAIILNPAHANVATLNAALTALRQANQSGSNRDIVLRADRSDAPVETEVAARLAASLRELRRQPVGDIVQLRGGKGRQISMALR